MDVIQQSTEPNPETKLLKIIAVGDLVAGKTCVLATRTLKTPPAGYCPVVFDNHQEIIIHDDVEYTISIWDTAGQEDYSRLRSLSYSYTACFLLFYSIDNRSSYDNILSKWYPELKKYCPKVPVILVATNCHLRGTPEEEVTLKEGIKLSRRIKAYKHMECSVVGNKGVNEIFIEAMKRAIKKANRKRRLFKVCRIQ